MYAQNEMSENVFQQSPDSFETSISDSSFCAKNYLEAGNLTNSKRIPWNKGLTKEVDERLNYEVRGGFKKGHIPWCKGTKGICKPNKGSFKKGEDRVINNPYSFKKGRKSIITEEMKRKISNTRKRLFKEGKLKPNITVFVKGHKINVGRIFSEKRNKKISKAKKGKYMGGESSRWLGGISFEPYGLDFNNQLREQIRMRDNYRCQECFRHQDELRTKENRIRRLVVHHIDYNKKNNISNNLISLCLNCHMQTNFDRDDWTNYFQDNLGWKK